MVVAEYDPDMVDTLDEEELPSFECEEMMPVEDGNREVE